MNPPADPVPANPTVPPLDPTAAPAPPHAPQYEFTGPQNRVIDDLAGSLAWAGIPLIVLAILYAVNAVVHFLHAGRNANELVGGGLAALGAVFFFVLSNWLGKAAAAFTRVTHTRGYDVTHLMGGLAALGRTFGVLAFLVQVYVAVAVVLLIVSLVYAFTGTPTP